MTTHTYHFKAENGGSIAFSKMFAREIYDSLPIFQETSFEEYYERNLRFITSVDRWEYIVKDDIGHTAASMVFCEDEDVHVGKCMLIMCAFSSNGSRLTDGYRTAMRVAKALGLKWLVYTKQLTPTEHRLVYKELK